MARLRWLLVSARSMLTAVLVTVGVVVVLPVLATWLGVAGPTQTTRLSPAQGSFGGPSDAMRTWSGYAAQAAAVGQPSTSVVVQLEIVHSAMHETVVALGLDGRPLPVRVRPVPDASAPAAIAAAAHTVLTARLPTQRAFLDSIYREYLAGIPDGAAKNRGVELGRGAAARVLGRAQRLPPRSAAAGCCRVGLAPGPFQIHRVS